MICLKEHSAFQIRYLLVVVHKVPTMFLDVKKPKERLQWCFRKQTSKIWRMYLAFKNLKISRK